MEKKVGTRKIWFQQSETQKKQSCKEMSNISKLINTIFKSSQIGKQILVPFKTKENLSTRLL